MNMQIGKKTFIILQKSTNPKLMTSVLPAVFASLLYLGAGGMQLMQISQSKNIKVRSVSILSSIALVCHAMVVWQTIYIDGQFNLGFYKTWALIFFVINLSGIILSRYRPIKNLLIILFPLSGIAVLVSAFGPNTLITDGSYGIGLAIHIGSSILAYAILTIAAAQAAVLAIQDHHLKNRITSGLVRVMPPLQLMEATLFELIWIGVVMLTLAISTGIVFMEDIFSQHLVHKTVLSMFAWLIFSILLLGRHQLGWRSLTAVRFTITGFCLLILAFFGSKLVLELVLQPL